MKDELMVVESDVGCASFTGHYYMRDATIWATLTPISGDHHALIFRAEGVNRYYQVGFSGQGKVSLYLKDFGLTLLDSVSYNWSHEEAYVFAVTCKGAEITLAINGEQIIKYRDARYTHGMFGFALAEKGSASFKDIHVKTV